METGGAVTIVKLRSNHAESAADFSPSPAWREGEGVGRWPAAYLGSFQATIAAGTRDIQRNIIGERVLGLPR